MAFKKMVSKDKKNSYSIVCRSCQLNSAQDRQASLIITDIPTEISKLKRPICMVELSN